ncbi:hypothetical protein [Streptomyces sp. Wb2n-11]|uniref:hypothetical protein n=1 Tax=Streptomyces sp. Wb2n-11 TaxID=1030533 RepID=UPI000A82A30A|nr:hypothetical protein [Streptomyces sp. Wb2n-11]
MPRAYPGPDEPPPDGSWRTGLAGCLLCGLVFALPGLAHVLGAPFLAGAAGDGRGLPAGTDVLLVGALAGWAWNQAPAHRAYTWLGLGDRPAAARALLTGAPTGALLGTAAAVAVTGPGEGRAAAFSTARALYQGAATALLVPGHEGLLLYALAPMALGALLTLVHDVPDAGRAALPAGLGAAVLALAAREVLRARRRGVRRGVRHGVRHGERRKSPAGPSLLRSLPYGVFGLAAGVLVLHAVLQNLVAGGVSGIVAAPGAVALSMGPAEWLLYRFRRRCDAGLRASTTSRAFRRAATATPAQCLGGCLAVLLALLAATTLLWLGALVPDATRATGLLLTGVMLWTGLLFQSSGAVSVAATVCGAAAPQTAALFADLAVTGPAAPAVPGVASAVLTALVCVRLGRATAHRH